jgi:hypothetical protein
MTAMQDTVATPTINDQEVMILTGLITLSCSEIHQLHREGTMLGPQFAGAFGPRWKKTGPRRQARAESDLGTLLVEGAASGSNRDNP